MNKIFTFLALLLYPVFYSQTFDFGKFSVEMLNSKPQVGLVNEDKNLIITFRPSEYFWDVQLKNKTDKHIEIDWDKSTFTINSYSSGITFNNTSQLTANLPKGKEAIAPNSTASKSIYPVKYVGSMPPTISKRYIKEKGEEKVSISLLITDENKLENYITSDFKITLKK